MRSPAKFYALLVIFGLYLVSCGDSTHYNTIRVEIPVDVYTTPEEVQDLADFAEDKMNCVRVSETELDCPVEEIFPSPTPRPFSERGPKCVRGKKKGNKHCQ